MKLLQILMLVNFLWLFYFTIISSEYITSYCSDCATINFIPTIWNTTCFTNVTETQACYQNNTYAYCVDYTSVDLCSCPTPPDPENAAQLYPDPYNEQKFINCTASTPTYNSCDENLFFDPKSFECVECVNSTYTYTIVNCTYYNVTTDCGSYLASCSEGEYFDLVAETCNTKSMFNCSMNPLTGLYPDTKNCSTYHQCVNGKEPGGPFYCDNGTVFNSATLFCDANIEAVSCDCQSILPNYVYCGDETSAYPTKNCKRYYQCTETSPGVFEPVVMECSADLLFNPQLNECVPSLLVTMCDNGILQVNF